ncbi:hypothetical protein [Fulvivirga sediminis]|uniref:hypothetical protein n=1 Tax=Fulvivirga sediminis TaxID=2803949 RepID=UPI001F38D879|nr:hypothetical protein [Fulvivirga sediminis]
MTKRISALPKRNRKDALGEDAGVLAIKATDVEYIENRTYKGKGKDFNFDWIWGGDSHLISCIQTMGGRPTAIFVFRCKCSINFWIFISLYSSQAVLHRQ